MMSPVSGVRVYLALGATDMRKSIDGLSILVSRQLQRNRQKNPFLRLLSFLAWSVPRRDSHGSLSDGA